jgi:imidazolonepropionase-like amidohydrolase
MLAIVNAQIYTCGPRGTLDRGSVLVRDGKIAAVGNGMEVPDGAEIIDARDMIMTPGFVDAHTHMGMSWQELAGESDTNESTGVNNAHLRALDSIDPKDIAFDDALLNGVTTVMVHPGKLMVWRQTISPIAGQSVVLKTRGTITHREILREPAGMKLAVGNEVAEFLNNRGIGPNSRMGIVAFIRGALFEAQRYRPEERGSGSGERDLKMEALSRLLSRELRAYVHVHGADDILSVLRLAEEYDLDIVLEHATEGHLVSQELAASGVPCVVGPITRARASRLRQELQNLSQETPGILAAAGVKVALMTDHPSEPIQFLPIIAGEAAREGMAYEEALKSITINAAEIMGVSDRVGSIEVGKDADLVIHDGDPLEAMTRIRMVVADGHVVCDTLRQEKETE